MKVLVLKSTAVKILEIMCEETSPLTKDLVENVFKAVDVDALHTSMAYFYRLSQDEDMVSHSYTVCTIYSYVGIYRNTQKKMTTLKELHLQHTIS